jgi:hypothetical protein
MTSWALFRHSEGGKRLWWAALGRVVLVQGDWKLELTKSNRMRQVKAMVVREKDGRRRQRNEGMWKRRYHSHVHECVYAHTLMCSWRPEGGVQSPGAGVIGSCEHPDVLRTVN